MRPLLGTKLAFAGALLSGVLYWAAFAGMDLWPFAFVAFGPLWIAMHGQTPKRALLLGWVAGTTMNVLGFYWLLVMLQTFSGFPTAACCFFLFCVCAYQGLRVGFMGWLYGRAAARGWPALPMFFAAFVASELVYPLLFPWSFAATAHKLPAVIQVAELGGPILVGLVLLAANVALFEPILARRERRTMDLSRIGACALGVGFALLFGVLRIPKIDARVAAAESVKVGVVQGNMGLLAKREDPGEGLRRHVNETAKLKADGADFVVWSESSVTMPMREDFASQMLKRNVGTKLGLPAIFGAVLYNRKDKRELWYNVAVSSDQAGTVNGRYDKEYLLQFGEHLPFAETFPILNEWSPNSGRFTPGTKLDPLSIDLGGEKHEVDVLICYEDIIPAFTNALVRATHPEMLVNITNDAWFGATTEPWEHLALAQLRAVEHRKYLVRSTNSGVSAVVDPVGRLVAHTEVRDVQSGSYTSADSLLATVHWMPSGAATVYEMVGDAPWWIVSAIALGCAFVRKRGGRNPGATPLLAVIALAMALCACTTSGTVPGATDASSDATSGPGMDASMPAVDSAVPDSSGDAGALDASDADVDAGCTWDGSVESPACSSCLKMLCCGVTQACETDPSCVALNACVNGCLTNGGGDAGSVSDCAQACADDQSQATRDEYQTWSACIGDSCGATSGEGPCL